MNILAANVAPTAFFTGSCDGQTCAFNAAGSDDPDGSIVSYSWDFDDGATGSGVTPSHSYASAGTYTVTLTVTDDRSGTDVYSADVTATPDPVAPDYAVADFNTAQGTLSGSYQATWAAGGAAQTATETHSGGKPSLRSDSLEHSWQFNLAEGNTTFNVVAQPSFGSGDDDTAFTFQWSASSNSGWADMVTVPGAVNTFDIPDGTSGVIYVRVIDNNSNTGNTVLSTISVDHMYFDGATPPTEPPAAASNPSPANGATGVPVSTTLSWSAGAGADTHDVYFGTTPGSPAPVSNGQAGTSYTPSADLDPSTTYYWRVDETNIIGTTAGVQWSFTTSSNTGPTELQVGSIVLSTVNAGKGKKNGRAVVTVVDDLGNPISGAAVDGTFSGSFNQNVSGTTSGGTVTFTTSATAKGGASFTFCVDSISGSLPYNAGQFCQNF
ncbi:PKD domain-containing protein [Pseudomonadota bacterium]